MIKKLTPVLIVDAIEPVLPLSESIGFQRTAEVPHGERLGFVILRSGSAEVMYQTFDSVRADEPKSLQGPRAIGASSVFVEVEKARRHESAPRHGRHRRTAQNVLRI